MTGDTRNTYAEMLAAVQAISACVTKGKAQEALAEECADLFILLIGTAIAGDFDLEDAFWNKMDRLGDRESRIIEGRIRVSEFRET